MSVNVELKTPNQNNITWSLSLKANSRIPIVAERTYATLDDAQDWVNDLADDATAYAGAIVAVVEDGKNNGIYYVQSIAQATAGETVFTEGVSIPGVLVAAGAGAGSEAVETYEAALAAATADNLGQILYVKTTTYKKGDGYTTVESEADVDVDGKIVAEYTAGPYIVTGANAIAKLGTTSATGDIAGDVESLKGRVSTAESDIDALQTAVGDANTGLVADVAALKTTVGDSTTGLVADVAANTTAIAGLQSAVAGGVHFRGVYEALPFEDIIISAEESYDDLEVPYDEYVESYLQGFSPGDIILVAPRTDGFEEDDYTLINPTVEPTIEYILVRKRLENYEDTSDVRYLYHWEDFGTCSVSDQKIAELEAEFDQHVTDMNDSLAPTIASAADYTANKDSFALKADVEAGYVAKVDGSDLVSNTLVAKLEGLENIQAVDTTGVLSLAEVDGKNTLSADLSGYVAKDTEYNALVTKVGTIAEGAQVNVIETVKVNGTSLTVEDKAVDIDLVANLSGKVLLNGTSVTANTEGNALEANIDASDINLSDDIGDHVASKTTVQSLLATVYDTANSKLGSIYLAEDTNTKNVLSLSKTNVANDTITLKIASGSAITATTNGLDLVWTEL